MTDKYYIRSDHAAPEGCADSEKSRWGVFERVKGGRDKADGRWFYGRGANMKAKKLAREMNENQAEH